MSEYDLTSTLNSGYLFLGAKFGGLAESFMFNMGHCIRKVELNSKVQNLRLLNSKYE